MATTKWVMDGMHSQVQFKVKHLVISTVTGSFKKFEGEISSENDDFTNADITFSLDVDSIDTNNAQRDEHLRSDIFFDAEKFPTITFKSTSFTKDGGDYKLTGDLTIKNNTQLITLDVEFGGIAADMYGNTRIGFGLNGKLSRKSFGLTWDGITEAGAIVLGDEVKLIIDAELVKQA